MNRIYTDKKIKSKDEIKKISKNLKEQGKTIVTTNGSFDILHFAHIKILEEAKKQGDKLIVLLNSDDSVKRFKSQNRPIIPQDERARMLAALECVDYVVIFPEEKPLNTLKLIKPQRHAKGGSFIGDRIKEEKELLESWGGEFRNFKLEEGFSTTKIINRILEKNGLTNNKKT
jgi:D-beta-D-heptose 7-phosphate kinase/D-beta-D-heptose 1-phosphate adenosyltransferase